jgi:uncharacterized protein
MWIAILLTGLVLIILHAVYFSGRVTRALVLVAPGTRRWLRPARIAYLAVACSVPVLLLAYAIYVLVAGPDVIGPPRSRLFDYLIAYPFWLVTIYSVQCSLLIAPLELLHFGLSKLRIAAGPRWTRRRSAVVLVIAAVFAVYVPVQIARTEGALVVRTHEYVSPDVPPALDGFEIALIADMQADRYTGDDRLSRLVEEVNRAGPDLVVIAGDMITSAPEYIEVAAAHAGRLRAPHGVYASVGDHDNFAYRDRERSLREVKEAMARHGVPMLDNEVRRIAVGDAELAVVLATHNYVTPIDSETTRELLEEARGADVVAVVAHQTGAELLADAREGGAHLFLSGHTHGGQIRFWLPFYDLALVRFETPYVAGAHRLGDMLLVVSNGLGVSIAPVRYRAPATIDLLRLRRPGA